MDSIFDKIRNNDVEGLKILIEEEQGEINKPISEYGRTPLMIASLVGADRRIIDILIKADPELEAKDVWGRTALHLAVWSGRPHLVEILLSRGSEVNPRDGRGRTPLHLACYYGYLHIVELLLGHNGIDANVVHKEGDTPLHWAVRGQSYDTVLKMLNKVSVKFDMEGDHKMTPFLQAVKWGHLGVIKKLLAKGAKVNAVNDEGNNCLHIALQNDAFHSEEENIDLLDKYAFKLSLTQGNRTCSTVVATYLFHFGANFYHPNRKNVIPLDLIHDRNLKEKLKTFLPPPCTYCRVRASAEFTPCGHTVLCRECYGKIKCESCSTCQRPIRGLDGFEAPKSEDRCVKTEATCQELGAASQAIESVNLDEKLLQSVAKKLGNKWQQLGRELEIKQVDLDIIKSDFPNDTTEQSFRMLYKWFQCCDPANRTLKTLTEALKECECSDALECLPLDTN